MVPEQVYARGGKGSGATLDDADAHDLVPVALARQLRAGLVHD